MVPNITHKDKHKEKKKKKQEEGKRINEIAVIS